jgi:hypothetical protein
MDIVSVAIGDVEKWQVRRQQQRTFVSGWPRGIGIASGESPFVAGFPIRIRTLHGKHFSVRRDSLLPLSRDSEKVYGARDGPRGVCQHTECVSKLFCNFQDHAVVAISSNGLTVRQTRLIDADKPLDLLEHIGPNRSKRRRGDRISIQPFDALQIDNQGNARFGSRAAVGRPF